jgi:hypothetical protein
MTLTCYIPILATFHAQSENQHVKFNVDVKVQNDPDRLFSLMHQIISAQPEWETNLAPRILLGLWHPRFLSFAKARLPYCRRSYIGNSPYIARKYFWEDCDAFSMAFAALTTADGQKLVIFRFRGIFIFVTHFYLQVQAGVQGIGQEVDGLDCK